MWHKLTTLPHGKDGSKWRTIALLEQNEEGDVHIGWDQGVLADPTRVMYVLRALEEAAIEAQMELMNQPTAA